jgi:hypothetical protein
MSWLLVFVEYYWSSTSSKSSPTSSSTSVSTLISLRCILLGYLVILSGVILWLSIIILAMRIIILRLCAVVLLLYIVVWWWYLAKLRCKLSCHQYLLHPYKYMMLFLSSAPLLYNPYHHDPLICKNCNKKFLVLSYPYESLDNDMDYAHVYYKSCTMVVMSPRPSPIVNLVYEMNCKYVL